MITFENLIQKFTIVVDKKNKKGYYESVFKLTKLNSKTTENRRKI